MNHSPALVNTKAVFHLPVGAISLPTFRKTIIKTRNKKSAPRTNATTHRACDAKIAALEREVQVLDELFPAMLDELMTGRLSVASLLS